MSKELLVELKWKRKVYEMWKEGQATWEEYRNVVRACREAMGKAHQELNLARDVKDNNKGFFKYISCKRKTRQNVGPLLNEVDVLVAEETERAELLNALFASVFTAKAGPQASQSLEVREEACQKEELPLIEVGHVRDHMKDHLSKLYTHISMGPDGMHP